MIIIAQIGGSGAAAREAISIEGLGETPPPSVEKIPSADEFSSQLMCQA
jgi:hypothetical protein